MTTDQIQSNLEKTVRFLKENPEKGRGTPPGAVEAVEQGLRCKVEGAGTAVRGGWVSSSLPLQTL